MKELLHKGKFINLVSKNGWEYVERSNNEPNKADAVTIIAFDVEKEKVVCIKEKRIPIQEHSKSDGYIISLPAGLIDEGETALESGARELTEETGYVIDEVIYVSPIAYNSSGLTNESTQIVYCNVKSSERGEQDLQGSEDIEVVLMDAEDFEYYSKKYSVSRGVVQYFGRSFQWYQDNRLIDTQRTLIGKLEDIKKELYSCLDSKDKLIKTNEQLVYAQKESLTLRDESIKFWEKLYNNERNNLFTRNIQLGVSIVVNIIAIGCLIYVGGL